MNATATHCAAGNGRWPKQPLPRANAVGAPGRETDIGSIRVDTEFVAACPIRPANAVATRTTCGQKTLRF